MAKVLLSRMANEVLPFLLSFLDFAFRLLVMFARALWQSRQEVYLARLELADDQRVPPAVLVDQVPAVPCVTAVRPSEMWPDPLEALSHLDGLVEEVDEEENLSIFELQTWWMRGGCAQKLQAELELEKVVEKVQGLLKRRARMDVSLSEAGAAIAVFGPRSAMQLAAPQLRVAGLEEERPRTRPNTPSTGFFGLHCSVQEVWDLAKEHLLFDAFEAEWLDLACSTPPIRQLLRERLREAVQGTELHVFMDSNPWEETTSQHACLDWIGELNAEAWRRAVRSLSRCAELGIQLSAALSCVFWLPKDAAQHGNSLRGLLAPRQMSLVTQDDRIELALEMDGFEDFAASISRVLSGAMELSVEVP
ncbi:unnamed protein product [Durusdinium trenchii]|uniref:Uncharacterized protein n=2 Tax=Durusdinium trenchii TaxID=1381693 RepID=A0ABP0SH65_9DINO